MRMADAPGQLLLDLVSAQGIAYGREDSFKMSRGRLLADRFLLGLRTRDVPAQAVLDIAAGIGMPEKFRAAFLARLGEADVVLFGVEDAEAGPIYKAYLEFWQKLRRAVMATGTREPTLLNLGFKWRARDNSINTVSRYTCFPLLDLAAVLGRVREIYEARAEQPSYGVARHLIPLAARRNAALIYLEVSEEGTPRRSYDINLYKANLTLAAIEPILLEAASQYGLPPGPFEALFSAIRPRLLGHLSGGMARDGSDFLTIYYETRPL